MSAFTKAAVALLGSVLGATACNAKANPAVAIPAPVVDAPRASIAAKQTAVISGGCFWGVQAVFQHVKGVTSVVFAVRPNLRFSARPAVPSPGSAQFISW